jgi:hypothetical protein
MVIKRGCGNPGTTGRYNNKYYFHSFQIEGKKMTAFSKQNYEDPDDGRILKAARKQQ